MRLKIAEGNSKAVIEDQRVGRKMEYPSGQQSFERHISVIGREQYEQNLTRLAKQIDEQGKNLIKKADLSEMQQYRTLISELLDEVVSNAYAFQKENSFDSRGRPRVYSLIRKVNDKLEELAKEF